MLGKKDGATEKRGQGISVGSKLPLDRKHLNVIFNNINKPSYQRLRPNSNRRCFVTKKDFFQIYMNQILYMREMYPDTDGKLCLYCRQPMTFISAKERTKAERKFKVGYVNKQRDHINTNMSVDRLDPNKNYQMGNIVFCCAGCNKRKNAVTPKDIINITRVYDEIKNIGDRIIFEVE